MGSPCPTPRDGPLERRPSPGRGTDGPTFPDPFADVLLDPLTENLFLIFGSQPIGDSTPDEWIAEQMADGMHGDRADRRGRRHRTDRVRHCDMVAVTTAGRGYYIRLYTPTLTKASAFAPYDRAWFEEVLATVQLQPEDAVDVAPSATPYRSPVHDLERRIASSAHDPDRCAGGLAAARSLALSGIEQTRPRSPVFRYGSASPNAPQPE